MSSLKPKYKTGPKKNTKKSIQKKAPKNTQRNVHIPTGEGSLNGQNSDSLLVKEERCVVVSQILKSLSHPERLGILCHLLHRDMSVGELSATCRLSQPQMSQFLNRMKLEEIVDCRKEGKFSFYFIAHTHIRRLIEALEKIYC